MTVPLCDLQSQYAPLRAEIQAAVCRVLDSGQYVNGPDVAAFEAECAAYSGAAHGVGCASGTDALSLALAAVGVGPGTEVVMPTFTFFATVGSVCRLGATPVFVDIDPVSYNIDPNALADAVTSRTKAVIPVHLFGQVAEMAPIAEIAERHHLAIIEDAAQSIGAEYRGKRSGTLGTIACLSFYPSKNLGTYGDAGLCTTDSAELATRMRVLRNHGMDPKYYHSMIGWNARLDTIHAAILRIKLRHLDEWTAGRQAAAARYDRLIGAADLGGLVSRPAALPERRHVWNQYVVRVSDRGGLPARDALVAHLKASGVGCEIYYPVPLHLQQCLAHLGHRPGDFPVSENAARSVLALPMFAEITEAQQARVVEALAAFAKPAQVRRAA